MKMKMSKSNVVQLVIDAVVVLLGICLYLFPKVASSDANMVFALTMGIYSGLELCEYIFDHSRKEPLYIFFAALTATISGLVLREYPANYVLSITVAVWILMYVIIKMINLEEVYAKKSNLFLIKLFTMSMLAILGILISINMYFRIETISFMLALLFLSYGAIEAFCDFMTFLSENGKFLKE